MADVTVRGLKARRIFDSRGNPTVEVEISVESGKRYTGRAAAPSGASTGKYEVVAFPKGGAEESVRLLMRDLSKKLAGFDAEDQEGVDEILHEVDGTPNFSRIGGNAAVATSMAVAKAAALALGLPLYRYLGGEKACHLPYPIGNVLGGGAHAGKMAPDIQEYISMPVGARRFSDAVFANTRVHKAVRAGIEKRDRTFSGGKGDEGAWAPNLDSIQAMEVVAEACKSAGEEVGFTVRPSLDIAASSLYDEEKKVYVYEREEKTRDPEEQIDFMVDLVDRYGIFYLEDPLQEEDFDGFSELTRKVGKKCIVCGDDLYVTNVKRISVGIKKKATNAVLIKPNQIGTLTDTLAAVRLTKKSECIPVISHRSGETTDETIAHLAVAWGCPMIKTGAVGGERIAKLNELIRIEEELGEKARMASIR
ncbi:MAG: phosphopyruvate hydratase [Candidatus Hadarchaeales archaeon]